MATLTYGNGLFSPDFNGTADNSPTGFSLSNLPSLTFGIQAPALALGDYRSLGSPSVFSRFIGTGFTYSSGVPTGGVINEWAESSAGGVVFNLTGISVPVSTFIFWAVNDLTAQAGATVFAGNDTIGGTDRDDTLEGYAGNDTLIPGLGNDRLIGDSGVDTVILPHFARQAQITGSPPGSATVTAPGISDALSAIERIQFIDGTRYYDGQSPAAQVARLYQSALGRAPDALGLASWVDSLKRGMSLEGIATGFVESDEFAVRFPGAGQDATAFVTQLYANVLNRAPDSAGLAHWVNALQGRVLNKAQVLIGFSESTEGIGRTASLLADGVWVAAPHVATVARLYHAALDRAPDAAGLTGWSDALAKDVLSLRTIANGFVSSAEFQAKYGALSNGDFVTLMYENVLGRLPDSAGFAAWTRGLAGAQVSRADVLVGFSESLEHKLKLLPQVEQAGVVLAG